jgi:hypothetical protein
MAKEKLSLTLDTSLLVAIDRLAKKRGQTRSACVQALLTEAMGPNGMWEFIRITGPMREIKHWMAASQWTDDVRDEPVEMVLRVTHEQQKAWESRRLESKSK